MGYQDSNLAVATISRFNAKQDEIKYSVFTFQPLDCVDDRLSGLVGIPVVIICAQEDAFVYPAGQRITQLLFRIRCSQSQDRGAATGLFYELNSFFYGTFFMRTNREAQVPGVDITIVIAELDRAPDIGNLFDTNEYIHFESITSSSHSAGQTVVRSRPHQPSRDTAHKSTRP